MVEKSDFQQRFLDGSLIRAQLKPLLLISLKQWLKSNHPRYQAAYHRNLAAIYTLLEASAVEIQQSVVDFAQKVEHETENHKKRQRDQLPDNPSKRSKTSDGRKIDSSLEGYKFVGPKSSSEIEDVIASDFMKVPSAKELDDIVQEFIERTSNRATETVVCACCGRESFSTGVLAVPVDAIPNQEKLRPTRPHVAHNCETYNGMLLESAGIDETGCANICYQCHKDLERGMKPLHSLSNNLWVGEIPEELKVLTLPERLLIAKYYPVAYIFKLLPKTGGAGQNLYSGYKGNVSTYRIDPKQVANMVDGQLMPPPSRLLSATIGVTFVTRSRVETRDLERIFRVQRRRVRAALLWLRTNNPLYKDIVISEERLCELPEDGVPDEITCSVRVMPDIEAALRESEGYVPTDVIDEEPEDTLFGDKAKVQAPSDPSNTDIDMEDNEEPQIFHIQAHGVVDAEGTSISNRELMTHALQNAASEETRSVHHETYAVKRGSAFVSEYPRVNPESGENWEGSPEDPNHLLGAFPTLFPYGQGGLEVERERKITYEQHVRWCMEYHDRRFRKDIHFPFMVFGVIQKRQVCRSAALYLRRGTSGRKQELIASLKQKDFRQAAEEESQGLPFTNPAMRELRNDLRVVRSHVQGTDESRLSVRSQSWGNTLIFNGPNVWLTINPSDTQDPVAQVFAGADIDLDKFFRTAGPNHEQRTSNVTSDPYASAKYFHFIINIVLETLFGISCKQGRVYRRPGIYGQVNAYIGCVEAQGRGSLHLHILLWLKDSPSKSDIEKLLLHEDFRQRVSDYISQTMRADIDGKKMPEVLQIPKVPAVSYSRPINPILNPQEAETEEKLIARSVQLHRCSTNSCLKTINGKTRCKRRAPFPCSDNVWVNDKGEWGLVRHCAYLNSWNPTSLRCLRANQDIKLIFSTGATCSVVMYFTNYQAKKQARTTNTSALSSRLWAIQDEYLDGLRLKQQGDIKAINKSLLQHCSNRLAVEREFSAMEIFSLLMGWSDRYISHTYATIKWTAAVTVLKKAYPGLRDRRRMDKSQRDLSEDDEEGNDCAVAFVEDAVVLKDQLQDYQYRGEALEDVSFFDFVINTYDKAESATAEVDDDIHTNSKAKAGRPPNMRIPYQPEAGKPNSCRVLRTNGHETIPRLSGPWVASRQDENNHEFYAASMLLLFKPWRTLKDLKENGETFESSWGDLEGMLTERERRLVDNFEFYHDCWAAASLKRDMERAGNEVNQFDFNPPEAWSGIDAEMEEDVELEDVEDPFWIPNEITNTMIEEARERQVPMRETVFAQNALHEAYEYGIFEIQRTPTKRVPLSRRANNEELAIFSDLNEQLKTATRKQIEQKGLIDLGTLGVQVVHSEPEIVLISENNATGSEAKPLSTSSQVTVRPLLQLLNQDQRRAHNIVEAKLRTRLEGRSSDQLKMMVLGPGGTGKSMLIRAITETFTYHGCRSKLVKCGSTGIAASDIAGLTVHSWAGLGIQKPRDGWLENAKEKVKAKRRENMAGKFALIIDEISMVTKQLFASASEAATYTRMKEGLGNAEQPFGGLDVILTGDFHQFPPIGGAALYSKREAKDTRNVLGGEIFSQFETVVLLEEQKRVTDPGWTELLARLRVGACTEDDIRELEKLIISNPDAEPVDFQADPWKRAILITPRNAVRDAWNAACVDRHCSETGERKYTVVAEDLLGKEGRPASDLERWRIAEMDAKKTGKLVDRLEIAVGMRIMVLLNLSTEADIANGTRGTIVDILLDPRDEPEEQQDGSVRLKFPPAMIVFKPDTPCPLVFEQHQTFNIPDGHVPIVPVESKFSLQISKKSKIEVTRRQFALTAAYAYTDYKSQGQTIEYVIIDLAIPPVGHISPFNAYVALSRSRGRGTIRLLREFDKRLFTEHPSEDLRDELERIAVLAAETKKNQPMNF